MCYIEDQVFFRSYDSVPRALPLLPAASCLFFSVLLRVELTDERGRGGGVARTKSYDSEIAWPSINRSILSGSISPHSPNL
jgi:hypothetical protein